MFSFTCYSLFTECFFHIKRCLIVYKWNNLLGVHFDMVLFSFSVDLDFRYFWSWSSFEDYLIFCFGFTLLCAFITFVFLDWVLFVEALGSLAVMFEAMLGLPQLLQNYNNRSTRGMRWDEFHFDRLFYSKLPYLFTNIYALYVQYTHTNISSLSWWWISSTHTCWRTALKTRWNVCLKDSPAINSHTNADGSDWSRAADACRHYEIASRARALHRYTAATHTFVKRWIRRGTPFTLASPLSG